MEHIIYAILSIFLGLCVGFLHDCGLIIAKWLSESPFKQLSKKILTSVSRKGTSQNDLK